MGLYIKLEDIRVRLVGKVRMTTDPNEENKMHEDLAERLIAEAEGQVEFDLSPRYYAPFQGPNGEAFNKVPERPTRNLLRNLIEAKAVIIILETFFGSGNAVNSDKYTAPLAKRYDSILKDLLAKKTNGGVEAQGFAKPPLPGLRLNYMNEMADDGFMGSVLVTGSGEIGRAHV